MFCIISFSAYCKGVLCSLQHLHASEAESLTLNLEHFLYSCDHYPVLNISLHPFACKDKFYRKGFLPSVFQLSMSCSKLSLTRSDIPDCYTQQKSLFRDATSWLCFLHVSVLKILTSTFLASYKIITALLYHVNQIRLSLLHRCFHSDQEFRLLMLNVGRFPMLLGLLIFLNQQHKQLQYLL